MKNLFVKIAAVGLLMLAPAVAQAAEGYSTANVNMRAGPSTRYPVNATMFDRYPRMPFRRQLGYVDTKAARFSPVHQHS
uniref:Peptide-binding protein n=1 Tax=Rhizobium leguminosarum bv. trifolii TaxID=386 RepID=A0A1C9HYE6_RHILT|nr:peptide-binding protein [Rhizobium leguminosarum bv. trifolii]